MILYNALCILLERPSRKSVLRLRMLPRRYLEEMGHTSHSSWKGIISPMLQKAKSPPTLSRKSEIMFTPSCSTALKSTLWRKALLLLAALVKETAIAAQAATKNSKMPVKVTFENNSVKYFFSVATNAFCRQIYKFVSCLLCLFYSRHSLIFIHYAILKFY